MAIAFHDLWKGRGSLLSKLDELLHDANDNYSEETDSATKIQRLFRGQRVRAKVALMRAACITISRTFRGHMGRKDARARAHGKSVAEEAAIFHFHSALVQRAFRGYYSRRYKHDYNARKAYIQSVMEKGNELREQLARHLAAQREEEARTREQKAKEEFRKVTENLHHLVSTANIPGIFNSPYMQDQLPVAMGKPVEAHLRGAVKDLLRTRDITKHELGTDLNGSLRVPLQPNKDKRSLQASSTYGMPLEASRMDAKLAKMARVGPTDFRGGQRAMQPPYQRGLNDGAQYMDPWKNPYLARGIPKSEAELRQSRTSLGKAPRIPFFTSVGGNKSAVHANTRFDVILDAEKTGGVTGRHKAMARGFISSTGEFQDADDYVDSDAEEEQLMMRQAGMV